MKNKYGLSRNIPTDIEREIRKVCGFGCVLCGASIIEYEHVDPPFAEAQEHDPRKITLLCPRHHSLSTRGFLSKETIKKGMEEPFCKKIGYACEELDVGKAHPTIVFGGVTLRNCQIPITVMDVRLFEVKEAEEVGAPYRLNAIFYNSQGELSLLIMDNEWRAYETNWDVEAVGGVVTIRDNPKRISLRLVVMPPYGIIIKNLDMYFMGYHFIGNPYDLLVEFPNGSKASFKGGLVDNCRIGISFS